MLTEIQRVLGILKCRKNTKREHSSKSYPSLKITYLPTIFKKNQSSYTSKNIKLSLFIHKKKQIFSRKESTDIFVCVHSSINHSNSDCFFSSHFSFSPFKVFLICFQSSFFLLREISEIHVRFSSQSRIFSRQLQTFCFFFSSDLLLSSQ